MTFPAGSQYAYSNSDNIAVGLMIERATGEPYPDVLAEQVLEPLGLSETSLPEGVEIAEPFIHGYAIDNGGAPEDVSNLLAAGWAWASGGVVSTPNDLNDFIRGYVSGALYEHPDVRAQQHELFIPAGGSEPPGPGFNSAGLGLFRYETPCGTVYGHSGNTFGYTQLAASSPDGTRSMTMSISLQRTHMSPGHDRRVFDALRARRASRDLPRPRRRVSARTSAFATGFVPPMARILSPRVGFAFCDASGRCLVRRSGNDDALVELTTTKTLTVGARHSFFVVLGDG